LFPDTNSFNDDAITFEVTQNAFNFLTFPCNQLGYWLGYAKDNWRLVFPFSGRTKKDFSILRHKQNVQAGVHAASYTKDNQPCYRV